MSACIKIGDREINAKPDIRILGVQIDTKLKWGPHIKKVESKMINQTLALSKVCGSTWGAALGRTRHVYTAVVRPAITYGSTVWYERSSKKGTMPTWMNGKLNRIQNRCLRTIAGAYKATPVTELEQETGGAFGDAPRHAAGQRQVKAASIGTKGTNK